MAAQTGVERVREAAERLGLAIEIRVMTQTARTAADAAAAVGCAVGRIVKSLVFADGDGLALLLVSGDHNVDLPFVRAAHGLALTRADATVVLEATGFAIGGVAPIGSQRPLPVYMDRLLMDHASVWCAAGRHDAVFEVAPQALAQATGATIIDMEERG